MPLMLPNANFATWGKMQAGYLYPAVNDGNNHIHVAVANAAAENTEIRSVSIKVNGANTNLGVGSAVTGFKFKTTSPGILWPQDDTVKRDYIQALQTAGLT